MLAGQRLTASVFIVGIVAAPLTTSANGTASSGTTETFDAVLGYYQATLINGHRYRVQMDGLVGNCGVANDIYTVQIRDSGTSSNPTSASTLVAQTQWTSATTGNASRVPIPLRDTFVASSSGTHTFGVSATRISGTGSFTPVNASGLFRELYVEDLGGN